MKLKQKLAEEELNKIDLWTNSDYEKRQLFLAGFEKARELACEIEWNAAADSEQLEKFKQLGEEEVN